LGQKYSAINDLSALGFLASALDTRNEKDGDRGAGFPRSDAEDLSRGGVRFIPGSVTLDRRAGKKVNFVTECSSNCWYWEFEDGSRVYHFDPLTYDYIAKANGKIASKSECGFTVYEGGAGPCPHCGNPNTHGGRVEAPPKN